jgi:deoxyribodipyrimidine photo-lyase
MLDERPAPLDDGPAPPPAALPPAAGAPGGPALLLLHEDDLHPESLDLGRARIVAVAGVAVPGARSPLGCAAGAAGFVDAAMDDALARAGTHFAVPASRLDVTAVADGAAAAGARAVIMPWAPVGWTPQALAPLGPALAARGIALHVVRRDWDSLCWPQANKGYFAFRERIPGFCAALVRSPPAP